MHQYRGYNQIITFSDVGGTISRWQYRGVDVFYPQQEVRRGGELKVRGGMHVCFPNFGSVDEKFGLSQHGPLRNRKPDQVTENGGFMFKGRDLLGTNCSENCKVQIGVVLEPTGFLYILSARRLFCSEKKVFINLGLHPYFRTPEHEATVCALPGRQAHVRGRNIAPRYESVGRHVAISIPGLGLVQMSMGGNAWTKAAQPKVVLWRDSPKYLCVEPVLGTSRTYGESTCLRLTEEYLEFRCKFEMTLM